MESSTFKEHLVQRLKFLGKGREGGFIKLSGNTAASINTTNVMVLNQLSFHTLEIMTSPRQNDGSSMVRKWHVSTTCYHIANRNIQKVYWRGKSIFASKNYYVGISLRTGLHIFNVYTGKYWITTTGWCFRSDIKDRRRPWKYHVSKAMAVSKSWKMTVIMNETVKRKLLMSTFFSSFQVTVKLSNSSLRQTGNKYFFKFPFSTSNLHHFQGRADDSNFVAAKPRSKAYWGGLMPVWVRNYGQSDDNCC